MTETDGTLQTSDAGKPKRGKPGQKAGRGRKPGRQPASARGKHAKKSDKAPAADAVMEELARLRENASAVGEGVQQKLSARIDRLAARVKKMKGGKKSKKALKKIQGKSKRLNVKPVKGRLKDLRRIARFLDRMDQYVGEDK